MRNRKATATATTLFALAIFISAPCGAQAADNPQSIPEGTDMNSCVKHTTIPMRDGTTAERWVNYCGTMIWCEVYLNGRRTDGSRLFADDPEHHFMLGNAGATIKCRKVN